VIVGVPQFDHGQSDEGAAFTFPRRAKRPRADPRVERQSNKAAAFFGRAVAAAGDTTADGFADVIAGADQIDSGVPARRRGVRFPRQRRERRRHSRAANGRVDSRRGGAGGIAPGDGFRVVLAARTRAAAAT